MHGLHTIPFAILSAVVFADVCVAVESQESRLRRLTASGVLIKPGEGAHTPRFLVPHDSNAGPKEVEALIQYCNDYAPNAAIEMFGPILVEEQLRQFRRRVPNVRVTHDSAVWFGITHRRRLDDGVHYNRVCRVESVQRSSTAEQAGLRPGDIILGIGDYRWPESDSYDSYLYALKRQVPGQKSTVTVKRDGQLMSFSVIWRMLPKSHGRPY